MYFHTGQERLSESSAFDPLQIPYPETPLENVYLPHRMWRGLTSKHTKDLVIVFTGIAGAATFVSMLAFSGHEYAATQTFAAITSSALAGFGAIYQLAKKRFSAVDVFSSEILARMRILAADNSIEEILRFSNPDHIRDYSERMSARTLTPYSVLQPSQESYFEIFFRRSEDLGGLSPAVVDHVTDFYSFHMAVRDQLRELISIIENFPDRLDEIQQQLIDVIFMLDLMAISALRALDELIEPKPHKWHSWQIVLCVAARANNYLMLHMAATDFRRAEVMNRRAKYEALAGTLRKNIKPRLFGKRLVPAKRDYF